MNQNIDQLATRLAKIEEALSYLFKLDAKEPTAPKDVSPKIQPTVPAGWMLVKAFCDQYEFVSASALFNLIKLHKGDIHHIRIKSHTYIDPLSVVRLFDSKGLKSSRLLKKYQAFLRKDEELQQLRNRLTQPAEFRQPKSADTPEKIETPKQQAETKVQPLFFAVEG